MRERIIRVVKELRKKRTKQFCLKRMEWVKDRFIKSKYSYDKCRCRFPNPENHLNGIGIKNVIKFLNRLLK